MTLLRKHFFMTALTTVLLFGCSMLPPSNPPLPAEESLPQTERTEAAATPETVPSDTTSPAITPTKKTPPASGEASIKPRLSYTVSEGELLWSIAKRADVYGDPFLWPLLYQANRDQIKDPRKIYAGQTLTIPRNLSEAEREKARNLAKKSDIFSPE